MDDEGSGFLDFCADFVNGICLGLPKLLGRIFDYSDCKNRAKDSVIKAFNGFNPIPYLNTVFDKKEEIIESIKEKVIDNLLDPMIEQLNEIRSQKADKEKLLKEAKDKLLDLRQRKQTIEKQLQEIV